MRIREVGGGKFHWLMRQAGAHRSEAQKAEIDASFSNTGYGVVKSSGKVIGLVTRYYYETPRYFVDSVSVFCEENCKTPDSMRSFQTIKWLQAPESENTIQLRILANAHRQFETKAALSDIDALSAIF